MHEDPLDKLIAFAERIADRLPPADAQTLNLLLAELQAAWPGTGRDEAAGAAPAEGIPSPVEPIDSPVPDLSELRADTERERPGFLEPPDASRSEPRMAELLPELHRRTVALPESERVELMPDTGSPTADLLGPEELLQRVNKQVESFALELKLSPRVLVAEEDPGLQTRLVETLASAEILADAACSAGEVWERLGAKAFAVLIIGSQLPDAEPLELLAEIRHGWPLLEVLLCVPASGAEQALASGASDYLPVPLPDLDFVELRVRRAQARHDFETRIHAVVQHLSQTFSQRAADRGPQVHRTYVKALQRTLEAYQTGSQPLRILVCGPEPLSQATGELGHPIMQASSSKEIEEAVRMGMAQIVVAADEADELDGVELFYRLRQLSTTVGVFVLSRSERHASLVEAAGTGIGEFLIRPVEGQALFVPRLKRLIERQQQMTRYRLLLEELKVMNINLMDPEV
ncbi:MAG: hypothetical protein JXR96_23865 [Deltaproteobacteria bacterium]|nr:hypothetical protein [Deltaproteobacteria bacterium]